MKIVRFNLADDDGIPAFGESLARMYRTLGFRNVSVFHEGQDCLTAETRAQMREHLPGLTAGEQRRQDLVGHALGTIRRRRHRDLRAEQPEEICRTLTAKVG
jgi:hypothetical protein